MWPFAFLIYSLCVVQMRAGKVTHILLSDTSRAALPMHKACNQFFPHCIPTKTRRQPESHRLEKKQPPLPLDQQADGRKAAPFCNSRTKAADVELLHAFQSLNLPRISGVYLVFSFLPSFTGKAEGSENKIMQVLSTA